MNQIIQGNLVFHSQLVRFIRVFSKLFNKIPTPQDPRIALFSLFFLPAEKAGFVSTGTADEAAALEFGTSALGDAFFNKFPVSATSDFLGFTEMEEDVFDGLFG
ncbi:MAG: hypothetical protein ACQEQ7_13160 [Thermodesulfobacteriota bacterium]